MKYTATQLKDDGNSFSVSDEKSYSIEEIRRSIYNLLLTSEYSTLPKTVGDYFSSINSYNEFWSTVAIQDYMNLYLYSDVQVMNLVEKSPDIVFSTLDGWLQSKKKRESSTSSGLCRVAADTSDKITDVVGKINIARGLYQNLTASMGSILSSPVDAVRKMVDDIVDSHVQEIQTKLASMTNLIGHISDMPMNEPAIAKLLKLRDDLEGMTTEQAVAKLRDNIQGQMSFTMSQFKEIRIQEVQHILDRACSISHTISTPFNRKSSQVDSMSSYYSQNHGSARSMSFVTTQNAIAAGAHRYNPTQLAPTVKRLQKDEKAAVESKLNSSYVEPPTQEEIEGVTLWNNAQGDSRIQFRGGWVSNVGQEGWTRVDARARVRLMRVQSQFGKRLYVNSAFRPPWWNKKVGGADKSLHMQGMAMDISWDGFNKTSMEEFINIAKACGFKGIGRYPHKAFVHVDIGTERSW